MPETEIHAELVLEDEDEIEREAVARELVAVVITRSGPVQLMPLVRLVSELRGRELSEVAPRIENSSGIILRDATKEEAETISQELLRQDVPFALVPTKELPELKEVVQLFRVRVGARGFRLRREDGRHVDIKWKDLLTVTCVRLEGRAEEEAFIPARLILSFFTREPFTCYQLSENIPADLRKYARVPYEPYVRFERMGRAVYETFPHSAQNKGMRILSSYGLAGKWKGLTFERLEEVHSYNYWVALLRKYQRSHRSQAGAKFAVPWLRRIEFEPEARSVSPRPGYRVRTRPVPPPARPRRPVVVSPREWMPDISWPAPRQTTSQGAWLNFATLIAAICLLIYIVLELLG